MLANVFKNIHDVHYGSIRNGMLKHGGYTYIPMGQTKLEDQEKVSFTKMPDSFTMNGKPMIIVKGERWLAI